MSFAITNSSLAKIQIPTSIVVVADDELVTPQTSPLSYAENIPNSEFVFLPSSGHFIFL